MNSIGVKIDLHTMREVAAVGVRRAAIFMGIGTNAARLDPPISHLLDDRSQLVVVPQEVSAQQSRAYVDEFESWIIANGFRELVETFSHFLADVFAAAYLIDHSPVKQVEIAAARKKFEFKGINEQVALLTGTLGLDGRFSAMFASLNQARNCFAHRRGVIGRRDVPARDQPFVLVWRTRALLLEDGRDVSQLLRGSQEIRVKKDQLLTWAEVERRKPFYLGEPIRLDRHELAEICFGMTVATEVFIRHVVKLAQSNGLWPDPDDGERETVPAKT